jgi:hypothetical protein
MVTIRRLIVTPTCRRFVEIEVCDFMLSERQLAQKYGVPWYADHWKLGLAWLAVVAVGTCVSLSLARV